MIILLDASSAIEIVLGRKWANDLTAQIEQADWVIAPDLFIAEVTNVYWKYYQFDDMPMDICETATDNTIRLVDDFIQSSTLYKEAFALSCLGNHPVYDALYLTLARRHNAVLLSMDKKLVKLANKHNIKTFQFGKKAN